MIVLADHSMDWSTPDKVISLAGPLDADPLLAGKVQIADNGGADLLYWTGPARRRDDAVDRMRTIARDQEGVLAAYPRTASWLRLGPEAGDVVVFCQAGWRFSDPDPLTSNPIPGNHGHPATRPIPFFIAGGSRYVRRRTSSSRVAATIDVAPTVLRLLAVPIADALPDDGLFGPDPQVLASKALVFALAGRHEDARRCAVAALPLMMEVPDVAALGIDLAELRRRLTEIAEALT